MATTRFILNIFILTITLNFALSTTAAETTPKREVRAAWVATVAGNWPKTKGTDASAIASQKSEALAILDNLKEHNFNVVYLQVRSYCDVIYPSQYEPWSHLLTGTRGKQPEDSSWNPLQYWIDEAHERGLELYAWVNPFRYSTTSSSFTTTQDKRLQGHTISHEYYVYNDDGSVYSGPHFNHTLNPGDKVARDMITEVCVEIVRDYDVDGIVFDDYFHPNRIPEDETADDWQTYINSGSALSIGDWRRAMNNLAVSEFYTAIKTKSGKPWMKFGIAPAGITNLSASKYGVEIPDEIKDAPDWQYNEIYADPLAWVYEGTIDFLSPQLYWASDHETNPFGELVKWYSNVCSTLNYKTINGLTAKTSSNHNIHMYASASAYNSNTYWPSESNENASFNEYVKEIQSTRDYTKSSAPGMVYYSYSYISAWADFLDHLKIWSYNNQALPPCIDWDNAGTNPGNITGLKKNSSNLSWDKLTGMRYAVYAIPQSISPSDAKSITNPEDGGFSSEYLLGLSYNNSFTISSGYTSEDAYYYAVTPIDRYGNEWGPTYYGAPLLELEGLELVSPNNGASIDLFTQQFSWDSPLAVSNETEYVIEISNDSKFSNIAITSTTTDKSISLDVRSLDSDGTYYWRVKAFNDSYASTTSESRSFTVPTRSSINVNLVSPENQATLDGFTYKFAWDCEFDTDVNYLLEVSDNANFQNIIVSQNVAEKAATLPYSLFEEQTYYWRVTAIKNGYLSTTTDSWTFVAKYPTLSPCRLILPYNEAEISTDITFVVVPAVPTDISDDLNLTIEVSEDPNFETIFYSGDSRWELEYDQDWNPHQQYTLPISIFYNGTYYWRVKSSMTGIGGATSAIREFTISGQSESAEITRDHTEYPIKSISSSDKIILNNLWINTEIAKSGYDAAGFCVRKDQNGDQGGKNIIYVSRHFTNYNPPTDATWAERVECHIDYYDAATGKYISTFDLNIGSEYFSSSPSHYFCNGLFCDGGNNLCFYGHSYSYTKDYNTFPSYMQISIIKPQVSESVARSGEFKLEIAEQKLVIKGTEISGEIEHFNAYGDITSGESYIFAANSNGNTVYRWHFIDGVEQSSASMTISGFYPSSATSFGSAPRIYPINEEYFYVDSYGTDFTLYKWGQSTPFGSFAQASTAAPKSSYGSGGTFFTHNGKPYIAYASSDYSSGGYKVNIAKLSDAASDHKYNYNGATSLWTVPNESLGSVDTDDDRSMAVDYLQHTYGSAQNTTLYLYSESNGMAAYTLSNHIVTGDEEITIENNISFTQRGNNLEFNRSVDQVLLYNPAGTLIADARNVTSINVSSLKGVYIIHIINNDIRTTEKIILK